MGTHDPIAYTYEADHHCPACATARFGADDDGYPPEDAEGNPIGAVFPWDEWWNAGEAGCDVLVCSDCGDELATAHDDECPGVGNTDYCVRGLDLDAMFDAYLECAFWSSLNWSEHDESEDPNPRPLDDDYSPDDLTPEARAELRAEVVDFAAGNRADILGLDPGRVGHDFWLTRNGHGTGFWDRGLGEVGDRLTKAADVYGEINLMVVDGRVVV